MNFQNKRKSFLLTLLPDHKLKKVVKYFHLLGGKEIDKKKRIHLRSMLSSKFVV